MSSINVHTQADRSTIEYVRFMWKTMLLLADKPERLNLYVHCIGPVAADTLNSQLERCTAIHVKNASSGGSFGHAMCIMSAFAMTTPDAISVICDSDAYVTAKGWDNYVHNRISSGLGMMGTTYEDVGGFSSGKGRIQTYKKAPTFTWSSINPTHNWKSLDITPNKDHQIHITTEELSKIYGLPVGYSVFGEAGWQLPKFLHENNITHEGWLQLKPTGKATILQGLTDYHEEYHADGVPFVVHHRGSLRHSYRGSDISKAFFERIDAHLNKEQHHPSRWTI